jgi:hypothetical protein
MNLINDERRAIVFELLEIYYKKAKTLADYDTIGYLAQKAEHRELYLKCAESAYSMAREPQEIYISRLNLHKAYSAMNMPEKALFYIDLNLAVNPDDFESHAQKAFNIALLGDKKTSEEMLIGLREKQPEKVKDINNALSGMLLRQGKTAEGIITFIESTKPANGKFEERLGMTRWDGIPRPGSIVYVDGEGGIGDEIINIRFFNHIKELGMKPILYSTWSKYREDTVNFFRRNGYDVITEMFSIDTSQFWVPMMSLPGVLGLDESKLWRGTYLSPLRNPKNKLPGNKFKIGIKCSGNPYFAQDEYRKIPLDKMLEYLPNDVDIYYIDKQTGHQGTIDLGDRINSWEDTLDFIDQMDCIVSSCTSLVHAAGAIGKTTFVVVPIAEYYVWTSTRSDTSTPWYGDNFQVHKQTKIRSWDEPLSNVRNEIMKLIGCKQ